MSKAHKKLATPIGGSGAIVRLLASARKRSAQTDEDGRIELYWQVGAVISRRIEKDGWGKRTVDTLAQDIRRSQPDTRGLSPQNLWRMRQFFDAYRAAPELAALARRVSWSANLHIIGKTKRAEEREFYLRNAARHGWQVRELEQHIEDALFERAKAPARKKAKAVKRRS